MSIDGTQDSLFSVDDESCDFDLPEDYAAEELFAAAQPPVEAKEVPNRDQQILELHLLEPDTLVELVRARYLQQTVTNLFPLFAEPLARLDSETADQHKERSLIHQRVEQNRLRLEQDAGVFGPVTRKAYEHYVSWLQLRAVPEAVRQMDSFKLPVPAGCPLTLPADRLERSLHPDLYRAMANANELKANLALNVNLVPNEAQLKRLEGAEQWLGACNALTTKARAEHDERRLNKLIEDGLPESWKRKPGEDLISWRSSAAEMIDLASRTRNYIEAMQSLYKLDKYGDMKISLPPGTVLKMEHDGKTFELTAENINEKKFIFKKGTVKEVRLELPPDLRQEHPGNINKIERLRGWLVDNAERIEQGVRELTRVGLDPDSLVMYGDQEVRNGKAVFNAQGEFTGLAKPGYVQNPGEQLQDANLLGYDFEVEPIAEKPGKFRITQTVTAEKAPWYAYQNFRFLGIEKLGVKRLPPLEVDGDDFVPVRNGEKVEMIKAKKLSGYKDWQQVTYYGEKGLVATMDVAMVVSGTIEIGAAVRGARIAATAANAGLKLEGSEAIWQLSKGMTRVTVGGAGVLNSAGGREMKVGGWNAGENINMARGLYFLGDISLGLVRGGWGLYRGTRASESISSAEKVHTIIHGKKVGSEVLNGIPYIRNVHTGSTYAFKATEYAFAPVIVAELKHQVDAVGDLGKRDPAKDAVIQIGDGRGLQAADKAAFDPRNKRAYDGTCSLLDGYCETLRAGRAQDSHAKIEEIFRETKQVLGPGATESDRRTLAEKLIANVSFTGDEIRDLEKAFPYDENSPLVHLTEQQLNDLKHREKRNGYPREVRELAARLVGQKDADVQAASEVALLFVARNADGNIGENLGELKIQVPGYDAERSIPVKARELTIKLQSFDVVVDLGQMFELKDGSNRGIVIGDTLCRIGALTHQQYAGVLEDILSNSAASREDKLRALSDPLGARVATIIDGLRYQESVSSAEKSAAERDRDSGCAFGLSSKDLLLTLERSAKGDANADVRGLAAAQLYALRERDPHRRAELLSAFNTMHQNCHEKPAGELAVQLRDFLRKEMQTPLPERSDLLDLVKERRLNAALVLALITPGEDKASQKDITATIVRSFSVTDPLLEVKVVEAMLPDRIKQLHAEDAALAHEFRVAVVSTVRLPDTYAKEQALVSLLGTMELLLQDADVSVKQQLKMSLELMLTRESRDYAEHFPSLRAAAIAALAGLGSQSSLDLIRSHAALQPKLRVGEREVIAGEPDARVRMAAAKALLRLRDVEMRLYVGYLIEMENDPTVSTVLRDFSFTEQRLDRDSLEYKRIYEQTLARLIDPFSEVKYPHLKGFNEWSANGWLDENVDLLKFDTFQAKAKAAVDGANDWADRRFTSDGRLEQLEWDAAEKIDADRRRQWEKLERLALGEGVESDKAKKALYYMMWSGPVIGRFGADGLQGVQSKNRDEKYHKFYCFESRGKAAAMLLKCCEPGAKGRDLTVAIMEDIFTTKIGGSASDAMGDQLLSGLKKLHTTGAISREKMAEIYARALENELKRPIADQREWLQLEIVKELRGLKYRMMYPAFEALSERSPYPSIKQASNDALIELRDSVPAIWNETPVDTLSPPASRAERVAAAVGGKGDADKVVQAIFNSYKGYAFDDPKDPGLAHLSVAMKDPNPRVRMVAAMVIVDSKLSNNHPTKAYAMATMGYLARSGCCTANQKGIFDCLNRVKLDKPVNIFLPGDTMLIVKQNGTQLDFTEYTPVVQRPFVEQRTQTITVMVPKTDPAYPGRVILTAETRQQMTYINIPRSVQPKTTWTFQDGNTSPPVTVLELAKMNN